MSSYKTFNDCNKRQTRQVNNLTLSDVLNNGNQASKDIDMFDNSIQNVNNITFSDNTYIGVGNSFDICSNEIIKINNDALAIDLSGNIGLGSIFPEEKIDVHGNAIVRGNLNVTGKLISNISETVNSTNNIKTDIVTVNLVDASNIKVDNIQVKQVDASNIRVDDIVVKQVDASIIKVDNIQVKQVDASNISVDNIVVKQVDASNISVDNIQVKQVDASNIRVDDIVVKQVDASNIKVDDISVNQLDASNIKVDNIVTVKQVDASNIKVDDISVKQVDASNIKVDDISVNQLDASNIRVDDISVNQLDASNIRVDDIVVKQVDASNIKVDDIVVKQVDASNIKVDDIQVKQVDASNIRVDNIVVKQVDASNIKVDDISVNQLDASNIRVDNIDISQNLKVDGRFDMNGDISMNGNLDINGNLDMKKNNIINVNVIDFSSNDASSNLINNLQGINFNDNTYIGVGNSFDICSNEVIKFNNDKLIVDTNGNIGVGKMPVHNLDVSGDLFMSGQITCFGNFASSSATVIASSSRNLNNGFRFQSIPIGSGSDAPINNIIQSSHNTQSANFRISPHASTTPWLFINTSGNIGIGTSSPVSRLDVNGNIRLQGDNRSIGTTTANSLAIITNNNNRIIIDSSGNVGIGTSSPVSRLDVSGNLHVNGNITATGTISQGFSDIRLKYKIEDISNTLILLNKIHAFKYKHNSLASSYRLNENDNNNTYIGLSAQEIQEIYPELVSIAPFDRTMDENGKIISKSGENYLTLQYERLVPITITAIQELNNKIINLENIIEKQQYQINLLLERL
jgi:hypothetical protein